MRIFSKAAEYITHNSRKEEERLRSLNIAAAEKDGFIVLFEGEYHRSFKKTKNEIHVPFAIAQNPVNFENMKKSWHMDEFKVPLSGRFYESGQWRADILNGRISKEGMVSFDVVYHNPHSEMFSYSCSMNNIDRRKEGDNVVFEGQWDIVCPDDMLGFDSFDNFTMRRYMKPEIYGK